MALRTPIVQVNGQLQQLQAGDTLNSPQAGGDVIVLTNNNAGAIVIGTPVYAVANDAVDKAQANAGATKDVIGLSTSVSLANAASGPIQINGVFVATTAQWDVVMGTTGGLTKGTKYWLSTTTAGQGSATAPSTSGQYVVLLGIAISTTELLLGLQPGKDILL